MRLSRTNREELERVALALRELAERVTFVGGAVLGIYLDPTAPEARPTDDVDLVTSGTSVYADECIDQRLRELDFRHDTSEGAPICRWLYDGTKVDVMSPDPRKTGFTNRWYAHCSRHRLQHEVGRAKIFVPEAPLFMAMKLEAYRDRGAGDPLLSKDLEDLLALLNGRDRLQDELRDSGIPGILPFVKKTLGEMLDDTKVRDVMEGLVPEPQRLGLVLDRMHAIAET